MSKSQPTKPLSPYGDEIDLRELLCVLWAGKWLIAVITVAATVIAAIVALMLPDIYRAEALLAPNEDQGSAGLSALAAQYGGLASLAGINQLDGTANKTAVGLEILKSRRFVSEFIERHNILVPLFAANDWNPETGELEFDDDLYNVATQEWVRKVSPPRKTVPSQQEAYERFLNEVFSVSEDKKTGFVRISVEHYSPVIAKSWVDWLIRDINAAVMRQDVDQAEQAIEYLNKQVATTSLAELRNVFYRLIEEQTKTVMLAAVSSEYLLRTLDPAVVPEKKAKPNRSLIVLFAAMFSCVFAAFLVLAKARSGSRT